MRAGSPQRGVVLIVVLWVIALLTLLLVAFSATVRVDRSLSTDIVQRVKGRAAAEAALNYLTAIQRLGREDWPKMQGRVFILPFEGAQVRFRLIPEEAYVSLTGASPEMLTQLIQAAGGGVDVKPIVERILQRRDGLSSEPAAEGAPPVPPLRAVEELGLLPGVNPRWLEPLLPVLTLDSPHPGVDPKYASPALLGVLLGADKARDLLAARSREDFVPGDFMDPALIATPEGLVFRLQVEVRQGDLRRRVEVTSRFGEGPTGYKILRWNEYTARFDLDLP
ncbi:MAG: hypothetical protein ABWY06_17030 [Pseudomonas sp.]|uniref:hypothetical protein n=1 Tax=Pseudomonas sp. TaxID=306 RepID=UPI003392870B